MKKRAPRKVTKADLLRSQRHQLKAMRELTNAFHLLRLQVQTAIRLRPPVDER